jgi:hypothetical protein
MVNSYFPYSPLVFSTEPPASHFIAKFSPVLPHCLCNSSPSSLDRLLLPCCWCFLLLYCGTDSVSRAFDRSRVRAPVCWSRVHPKASVASADDKIVENEEVAPRITPVAAARRSRPFPRARPLLRIGDPSPYAPSPALPSVDPAVLRSYPLPCATRYQPQHSILPRVAGCALARVEHYGMFDGSVKGVPQILRKARGCWGLGDVGEPTRRRRRISRGRLRSGFGAS